MNIVLKNNDIIHIKSIVDDLKLILNIYKGQKTLVLTDENCMRDCFPLIEDQLIKNTFIFVIKPGEENKTLETVEKIWNFLIKNKFNRKSLMINLGGGVITDIGGFAASTFKRGMPFINIPTTLLSQVDASVGGKTGINYAGLKNEIGMFSLPDKVVISPIFLKTLNEREFLSGFAEMIKHALISDRKHLEELKNFIRTNFKNKENTPLLSIIKRSVTIKEQIVKKDIKDKGIRNILNFGHTFGHAFESYFNDSESQNIKHGEAVAYGMICELFISSEKIGFNKSLLNELTDYILTIYGKIIIPENDYQKILEYILHDKKNITDGINCVLLQDIENPLTNQSISENEVIESLIYLNNI